MKTLYKQPRFIVLAIIFAIAVSAGIFFMLRSEDAVGSKKSGENLTIMLTFVNGSAEIERGKLTKEVSDTTEVFVGDSILTSEESRAFLIFEDNSSIVLNASTKITIDQSYLEDKEIYTSVSQESGQTWTRVKKLSGTQTDFEVETPQAIASVRGTGFDTQVNAEDNSYKFAVEEGTVEWSMKSEDTEFSLEKNEGIELEISEDGSVVTEWVEKVLWDDEYFSSSWVKWNTEVSKKIDSTLEEDQMEWGTLIEMAQELDLKNVESSTDEGDDVLGLKNDTSSIESSENSSMNSSADYSSSEENNEESASSVDPVPVITVPAEITNLDTITASVSYLGAVETSYYMMSIGTNPNTDDIVHWREIEVVDSYTFKNVKFENYNQYFVNLYAVDLSGGVTPTVTVPTSTNAPASASFTFISPKESSLNPYPAWKAQGKILAPIKGMVTLTNINEDQAVVNVSIQDESGAYWNGSNFGVSPFEYNAVITNKNITLDPNISADFTCQPTAITVTVIDVVTGQVLVTKTINPSCE